MRRIAACLLAWSLAGTCLLGCGDAPTPKDGLRSAEAPPEQGQAKHPELRRRAAASTPSQSVAAHEATVDAQARITIPAAASWDTVHAALEASAQIRRKRERLDDWVPVLVSLPGLPGYVNVGREPTATGVGLALRLREGGATRIEARGHAWVVKLGCEAPLVWEAEDWSLAPWHDALAELKALGKATERGIRVRADDAIPAATVLAFLAAASAEGLGAPWIETGRRRRFTDPAGEALRWLAAHQMPSGAWDVTTATAYCDGQLLKAQRASVENELPKQAGLTGLVLCSFLSAGYTNRGKHPFARVVQRGLRYLKKAQTKAGVFSTHAAWSESAAHGWATLAMLHVFGLTNSPIYKGPAQRGLDALESTWRRSGNDPLATVQAAMGLRLAQHINSDATRRGKAAPLTLPRALGTALLADARTYAAGDSNFGIAAGLLTRLRLGEDDLYKTPELGAAAKPLRRAFLAAAGQDDPGLTWLTSLANYNIPGSQNWKPMNKALGKHLVDRGRTGGHVCCLRGSWDAQPDPSMPGGRVAATALRCLTLQLVYRYDRLLFRR